MVSTTDSLDVSLPHASVHFVLYLGVSKNNGTPKSSILIGFSIIFTIHFGFFPPIFGNIHLMKVEQGNL